MKILEVEVTGEDGTIEISQPSAFNENGKDSIFITIEQLDLFIAMLRNAKEEAECV